MSFEDAAALPLTFQTAWEGLVEQMNVARSEEPDNSNSMVNPHFGIFRQGRLAEHDIFKFVVGNNPCPAL